MNKVILMGRLVADPVIRYTTANNIPYCWFRLAVNKPVKQKEGQASAVFFNIVAWRNTAEFIGKYLKKGIQILIEGHLKTNSWDDNGTRRYEEFTQADHVYFADSKKPVDGSGDAGNSASAPNQGIYEFNEDDEDLPF